MKNKKLKLKYRRKVIIIFVEYFVFILFFQIIFKSFKLLFDIKGSTNFLAILFTSYLIYYSLFEFIFNKSFIMSLYKVEIDKQKKSNIHFILYTIFSILDRTILIPFHMLLTIMNYENLLLCEKLSGMMWKYSKK